ncbi:MAG: DUF3391 domain-containing protein, partial [Pseudomonadota bacterium]
MDKKQIPVAELRLGMYVTELDRPWIETPFAFQGFPIASADQIDEVKKHCETVFIDLDRDTTGDGGGKQGGIRGTVVYKEVTAVEKE